MIAQPVRVVDADGADVPADGETLGEIALRGNNVMLGYYRDPEATAAAAPGGWFRTGDLGVMHPDGYVELRDRLKDVIISGGENIASVEVEQVHRQPPGGARGRGRGAPRRRASASARSPSCVLVAGSEARRPRSSSTSAAAWRRFKAPSAVVFCDELPRTATGKVQKFLLREQFQSAVTAPADPER